MTENAKDLDKDKEATEPSSEHLGGGEPYSIDVSPSDSVAVTVATTDVPPNRMPNQLVRLFLLRLPEVLQRPYQLRTLVLIIMQVMTVISLISQAVIFYRDLEFNKVLDSSSTVAFPSPNNSYMERYVSWDDVHLKIVLRRHLVLPLLGIVLLIGLLIFNVVTQVYDWKNTCLLFAAMMYSIFGLASILLAIGEIYCTIGFTTKMFEKASVRLLEMVPLDQDVLPYAFPPGNPISVRLYPQYFLQIMDSCQQGNVNDWEKKSELMGIRPSQIRIPSYRQLVKMGFCIDNQTMYVPVIILIFLGVLSWINVFLCYVLRNIGLLFKKSPPTLQQVKLQEFEAVLKAEGKLGGQEDEM